MRASIWLLFIIFCLTACGNPPLVRPETSASQATVTPISDPIPITPTLKQDETSVKEISTSTPTSSVRVGKYEFSQPKRIFSGQAIQVIEWLPDGQRLLVTQPNVDGAGRRLIEIVDLKGQQVASFGTWYVSPQSPIVFSPTYETITFIGYENEDPKSPGLMVVNKEASAAIIAKKTAYFGALSDGTHLWAVNEQAKILNAPSTKSALQKQMAVSTLSLTKISAVNKEGDTSSGTPLSIVVNPTNPNQAIIFNDLAFLVADLSANKLTEIDLGEEHSQRASGKYWALEAQWSPDGRQVAVETTVGEPITGFSNLTIFDTSTWSCRHIEIPGIALNAMSWFPNSQDMLLRVHKDSKEGLSIGTLYLFDTITLESQLLPLFSEDILDSYGRNILWSPNNQEFITPCVLLSEVDFKDYSKTMRQICLIEVTFHP